MIDQERVQAFVLLVAMLAATLFLGIALGANLAGAR